MSFTVRVKSHASGTVDETIEFLADLPSYSDWDVEFVNTWPEENKFNVGVTLIYSGDDWTDKLYSLSHEFWIDSYTVDNNDAAEAVAVKLKDLKDKPKMYVMNEYTRGGANYHNDANV